VAWPGRRRRAGTYKDGLDFTTKLESGENRFRGNLALSLPHQPPFFTGNSPPGASKGRFFEWYPPLFKIRESSTKRFFSGRQFRGRIPLTDGLFLVIRTYGFQKGNYIMKCTSILSHLPGLLLVLHIAAACTPGVSPGTYGAYVPPTATIPPDVDAKDIYIDYGTLETIRSIAEQHPGGVSAGFDATYDERFSNSFTAFHVASGEPFIGQAWIWNADPNPHDFAALCLLNYVQVPCTPESPSVHFQHFAANEEVSLPIELPELEDGIQDFEVLIVRDPYRDIDEPDLQHRSETFSISPNCLLYVGESTQPPDIERIFPDPKPALEGHGVMFFVSELADPLEQDGGILIWLSTSAEASEMIDFYIHLSGEDDLDPDDKTMAAMAFVDYEQVPLYVNGEPHLPLYMRRKTKTWQPVAVQIRAPDQPGVYELLVTVHDYAHSGLTKVGDQYVSDASTESSQLVRLEVKSRSDE